MLTLQENLALRSVLAEEYRDAPDEQIQELLDEIGAELNAAELAGIGKALKQLQKALPGIAKVGQQALPGVISGATTGATVGGPWGALIGGVAGGGLSLAGGARPKKKRPPSRPRSQAANASKPATQLLQVMQSPQALQALLALAMGPAGKKKVPAGKTNVTPIAFLDLIKTLVNRTAAESEIYHAGLSEEHLLDENGEYVFDPANPDERAEALQEQLYEGSESTEWQETLLDPVEWLSQATSSSDVGLLEY